MDNGQPLIERPEHGAAAILRRVADQIDKMNADTFGGVAVVVPPANSGEPIEFLIIDPKKNAAQFYATIQTRIANEIAGLETLQRQQQAVFGQRR
jgi:septum formation inhibitor-activating ATPase MinD